MSDLRSPTPRVSPVAISALALILGLLAQSAGIVWWGSAMTERMAAVEAKVNAANGLSETVARVDERTAGMVTTINRLDARITAQDDAALSARRR